MRGHLTVDEAARALGTSPQTIRTLLRTSQLQGTKRPWGSRYVWEVSAEDLDRFLGRYGRFDGARRRTPPSAAALAVRGPAQLVPVEAAEERAADEEPPDRRPLLLRPRGRSTVMVVVLGAPMLVVYLASRTLPGVLWFREVGQGDVFTRTLIAQVEFRVLVVAPVSVFVAGNLAVALRGLPAVYRRSAVLGVGLASLVVGAMFGSAVAGRWQAFVLWQHRQSFGVVDPVHRRDVGYFVFSLPFELLVVDLLLWMVVVTAVCVSAVYVGRGRLGWRPRRASLGAQQHLAVLAAVCLLAIAWRLHLERFVLELQQPSPRDPDSFAGADYVDVYVRMPGLVNLSTIAVVAAAGCLVAPRLAHHGGRRRARVWGGGPVLLLAVGSVLVTVIVPAIVQRFVVDPNPLLRERPLVAQSIAATRAGLGLADVAMKPYAPTHRLAAADFPSVVPQLRQVQVWDSDLLGSRMRELVTDTPYFRPEDEALDVVDVKGEPRPAVVSVRDLDLNAVRDQGNTWINDRLAYTHGSGVIRFSATQTGADRGPRLLEPGAELTEPRIYFGDFARSTDPAPAEEPLQDDSWVLADTQRAEVDSPTGGAEAASYHYTGSGGIALSSWARRAAFALAMGSKQLLLSDDITRESRLLLHRDVHERLDTLAPFLHWDATATPLISAGRVVYVVDGYTTSTSYPFAQRVDLGGTSANYVRPSVRATVDAFSGQVALYLVDADDPVARAWAAIYPSLFLPGDAMPVDLRDRLRYPAELFDAQATAYERFHTLDPGVFTSDSDAWSRPLALSGPIEVASEVDFDESDEDSLRLTMQPAFAFARPEGADEPRITLSTYYVPTEGQNLVARLTGWIDDRGRPRLTATDLPRDPVTLGPAQVSRLVFATPRVSRLLGLRNLEVRDLNKSSIDSVILGRPHLLLLPGGVLQVQSLYEGSRGPGAARLLGVTAYINGRAGLGTDIVSAVRQAMNDPPSVDVRPPQAQATVGQEIRLSFRVHNAARETVTIASAAGRQVRHLRVTDGGGAVSWTPAEAGPARVRVSVLGLDGTVVDAGTSVQVLDRPPRVRLLASPGEAVVGEELRVPFRILFSHHATATVSTRSGIVFRRRFHVDDGRGVVAWTPEEPGAATLRIRARGKQGQTTPVTLGLAVRSPEATAAPPPVQIVRTPEQPRVGVLGTYAFAVRDCSTASVRIEGPSDDVPTWRFPCSAARAVFRWTPTVPGDYRLTTESSAAGFTSSETVRLAVAEAAAPPAAVRSG